MRVVEDVRVEFPRGQKEEEVEDKETPATQCPPLGRHLGSLPYDVMFCILIEKNIALTRQTLLAK